jgi:molybdopterin-biosynthesis enzyme MoeA-like protein
MSRATIVTVGNELLCGDVENTNGSWLARRLAALGVEVALIAVLPDEIETVAAFVRDQVATADVVLVEQSEVAERLRARFRRDPEYVARWARLPEGSRALENPLGGAPGFAIGNVYVLPGLPAEMEAMFETLKDELRSGGPSGSWRRTYHTTESRIVAVLEAMSERHPRVLVGSYPSFPEGGSEVEVVVRSADPEALAAAAAWIETALEEATK